jgi:hypothetical protein
MASVLNALDWTLLQAGDDERAASVLGQSLLLAIESGRKVHITESLRGLGMVAVTRGKVVLAARLFGEVATQWEANGEVRPRTVAAYQRALAAAQLQISEDAWLAAWIDGQRTPLEELVAGMLTERARQAM